MLKYLIVPLILLPFLLLTITGGAWAAERWPSSELLLPCFEVRLHEPPGSVASPTTYLTLVNTTDHGVLADVVVKSNWGLEIVELTTRIGIGVRQVRVIDLGAWIRDGRLPGRQLAPEVLEHVQAALCGERSPRDGLFYSTPIDALRPRRAVGSVSVRTVGPVPPDILFGDFFLFDWAADFANGDVLSNLDPSLASGITQEDDLCTLHGLRFLEGGVFSGTRFMIWNEEEAFPSSASVFPTAKVPAIITAYSERGHLMARFGLDLMPMEIVAVDDLGLPGDFGWMEIDTLDVPTAMSVEYSATGRKGEHAVAMEAVCLPRPGVAAIDIETRTNGFDADRPTGPRLRPGSEVHWEYLVTNVGEVPLSHIEVTDGDPEARPRCPRDELEPGRSMTCVAEGVAHHCQHSNRGYVTALATGGETVTDNDPSHYFAEGRGGVRLEKATNGEDADVPPGPSVTAGSTVVWTYTITNTGDADLVYCALDDDKLGQIALPNHRLAVGETRVVEVAGIAQLGQYRNVAGLRARTECGIEVRDLDASHYFGEAGKIDLEKYTNEHDADTAPGPEIRAGDEVVWVYVVSNVGATTLYEVVVGDDQGETVVCPRAILAPGETMSCIAEGVASEGQYQNVGTVIAITGEDERVSDSDPSHYYGVPSDSDGR